MSLEEGQEAAMVTGGLFRFWDTEWPVPGGTEFQVTVYDSTGPNETIKVVAPKTTITPPISKRRYELVAVFGNTPTVSNFGCSSFVSSVSDCFS